ncbi:VENN motif pre-toxin domain-containing protein [Gilliamella apicola]|uniref:VENN motif pre-toxin domain-containing protein n=1 Tax=Gilliamella apicola TaxID=1196095 RepID=UPI00080F4DE0|nr:VENN motif pre-toxin domain-containing protein [Gilliamella apis]OCF97744.1 hypothetical protein A9G16_07820 [Gilliamella apis]
MGNDFSKGVDSAVSIITGIITGDITGGLAGASAPWLAEQIKLHTGHLDKDGKWQTDDIAGNLIAHAILGAVVAELQGNSSLAGGTGAVIGESAAWFISEKLYGKKVEELTESEKENMSALAQLATGFAVAAGGGSVGDASAAISSSKNAVENNSLAGDYIRDEHKGSITYWKDQVRETVGENTISQITNGVLTAYGDTVDLGVGIADTVLDAVLALSSCAVGASYCDTAMSDLRKSDQTIGNAMDAIINGQAWDAIKGNVVKAANGDQVALENTAALLTSIIAPSKVLGNIGKPGNIVNKVDDIAVKGSIPEIKGTQVGLRDPAQIDLMKSDMLNGSFEFTATRGKIAGYIDSKGNYYITEGHHRMATAQEIY